MIATYILAYWYTQYLIVLRGRLKLQKRETTLIAGGPAKTSLYPSADFNSKLD